MPFHDENGECQSLLLKQHLTNKCGNVKEVKILNNGPKKIHGQRVTRGMGFVFFGDLESVNKALALDDEERCEPKLATECFHIHPDDGKRTWVGPAPGEGVLSRPVID